MCMNAKALKLIYLGKRSNMMPPQEEAQLFLLHPPFKCAHVGKRELMRVLDMQNDCYNTVRVSSLPDPGLVQLHIACLSVPDAMAWIQQYR